MENDLKKARLALATAYQAFGVLAFRENYSPWPSDSDMNDMLDMLSRWEGWTCEQIDALLPWPKRWHTDSADSHYHSTFEEGCPICERNAVPQSEERK